MKILFLLTQDLESPAGGGRYLPWAKGLARSGNQVSIAALHSNYASLSTKSMVIDGVQVDYVAQMHVMKDKNLKKYFSAGQLIGIVGKATIELIKKAWKSDADIIQIGKPHPMNGMAGLVSHYLKKKIVFLDCDDFEMANIHFGGDWQKAGVHFFETNLPKRVDYVSVHTTFLKEQVLRLGVKPDKVIYLPHGVDQERFSQVDMLKVETLQKELGLAGKKVITFIGSLSLPSHPVEILLDAFQQVSTAIPEAVLLIVGGGEEYEHLVAKVSWLGLTDKVIFRGRVPGADVPVYYKVADVSAEPVVDNPVGRSSLPIKMFESWSAGVPFVTQDVGDRRLVLGEPPAGIAAEPGNANSLARELIKVLSDAELADQLRQRGYDQARRYSWQLLSKQMEEAYSKALRIKNDNRI